MSVCIRVPLAGKTNVVLNIAKLAEDKYGWAALHPQIAATAAELFDEDGDESDESGDEDGGAAVKSESGATGTPAPTDPNAPPAKVKAKRKTDGKYGRYDINDPFIDDSELLLEEQAASTKDGFFVFSGPLISETEQVRIERADGTVKRGRGRGGRPPGSGRGKKAAAAAAAAASTTTTTAATTATTTTTTTATTATAASSAGSSTSQGTATSASQAPVAIAPAPSAASGSGASLPALAPAPKKRKTPASAVASSAATPPPTATPPTT